MRAPHLIFIVTTFIFYYHFMTSTSLDLQFYLDVFSNPTVCSCFKSILLYSHVLQFFVLVHSTSAQLDLNLAAW